MQDGVYARGRAFHRVDAFRREQVGRQEVLLVREHAREYSGHTPELFAPPGWTERYGETLAGPRVSLPAH